MLERSRPRLRRWEHSGYTEMNPSFRQQWLAQRLEASSQKQNAHHQAASSSASSGRVNALVDHLSIDR